jgi:hypothetical protein
LKLEHRAFKTQRGQYIPSEIFRALPRRHTRTQLRLRAIGPGGKLRAP